MPFITRILLFLQPLIMFIDRVFTLKVAVKGINGDHYFLWRDRIQVGYVFLTTASGYGSNLINPSDYNHGALYFGKGLKSAILKELSIQEGRQDLKPDLSVLDRIHRLQKFADNPLIKDDICYVLESVGAGVIATNLVKFLTTKDKVKIYKPLFASNNDRIFTAREAICDLGLPYDFGFTSTNEAKYCFEYVAQAYERAVGVKLNKVNYDFMGLHLYDLFLSSTFDEDIEKWECVIDSADYPIGH